MNVTDKNTQTFCSLADIRARKDQLQNEIYADEETTAMIKKLNKELYGE